RVSSSPVEPDATGGGRSGTPRASADGRGSRPLGSSRILTAQGSDPGGPATAAKRVEKSDHSAEAPPHKAWWMIAAPAQVAWAVRSPRWDTQQVERTNRERPQQSSGWSVGLRVHLVDHARPGPAGRAGGVAAPRVI